MFVVEKLCEELKNAWLELLKASGWKTGPIAVACGVFLLATRAGWLPPLAPWMILWAAFVFLLCGFMALASFAQAVFTFFPVHAWFVHWVTIWREKRAVRAYIPYMTSKEREIISYLLVRNQKMFTADETGGYAATLMSRGIIVSALRPGQVFDRLEKPMAIPDHIWSVLLTYKDQFPCKPTVAYESEECPWCVPWVAG
jgi:hypothetical protein